jgi:hypothetical protein
VIRGFALTISVLEALASTIGRAQTNLDQGKSASQIFSAACIECHKSTSVLAKRKSAASVAEFLREHYTTNGAQAAALAAYVTGGRDSVASPVPGKRPPAERAAEWPKPDKNHAQKPPKPEEGTTANAKPRRPAEAEAKPKEEASPSAAPSLINPILRPEPSRPATATRNRRKEPAAEPVQEPAALADAPAPGVAEPPAARPEMPSPEAAPTPTATAPAEPPASGEPSEPAPRDNVPD